MHSSKGTPGGDQYQRGTPGQYKQATAGPASGTKQKRNYFLDKCVVITGASSGIGRTLAFWYLNNGAKVALVGRDMGELEKIGRLFPAQALVVKCDLTIDINMFHMKQSIQEKFGRCDILINCAGNIFAGDVESTFPQDYDYLMDLNLRTPFVLTHFFNEMLADCNGVVVNLSCEKGSRPEPGLVGYCMAKAGVEMLTKSSALELAPLGIRVNAVAPCFIQTEGESNMYRYAGLTEPEIDALKKRAAQNIPLKRKGEGLSTTDERIARDIEVAKAIVFLTSEMATKITGHVMKVDGGKSLTSKGQSDWYGWQYMNRKFEQDGLSYYQYHFTPGERVPAKPFAEDKDQLNDWVRQRGATSKWTAHDYDMHIRVSGNYSNQVENLDDIQRIKEANADGGLNNPKSAK